MLTDVLIIDGSPKTYEDALNLTFAALRGEGYVEETFLQGCIDREKTFPSGLEMEVPVAIPHTNPEHVKEPALCVLRLAAPVAFGNMGDPDQNVNVEFVFNMALKDTDGQLEMLREIMAVAQDADFLRRAKTMPPAELRTILGQRWKASKI
ncbi:PTS sugar transporter subunit IIA [Desulfovibrio sp. OttesenSCG-928-O18]|nr:PTS sugar transporter subunit IIA [Desulfovibrio sp. OttesenSCG-928-O18]